VARRAAEYSPVLKSKRELDEIMPDVGAQPTNGNRGGVTLQRIMEGSPPRPPSLKVDQFLLAADVNLLGGHGGGGKSTLLFHTAVCAAVNRRVFGTLAVRESGPVALLVPEDGAVVARHHLDAIAAGLELTAGERAVLEANLYIVGDERPINLLTDTKVLAELLDAHGVDLLFCDPIASLIGGQKEDDEAVAGAVCDNLRRNICRPLQCTVGLAHHLRKPGRETVDAAATVHDLKGSAGWANHARQVWSVTKPKGGSTITLRLVKSNRLRTDTTHELNLTIAADPANEAHWLSCRLVDANAGASSHALAAGIGRAINENERKALLAIDDRLEPGRRVSWSEWTQTAGINKDSLKSIKVRLLDAGLAQALPSGVHRNGGHLYNYAITDRGRSVISTGWVSEGERVR
jgi:hypothetical protein